MTPIEFPQCNFTFLKPEEMTDDECGSLPVCRTKDGFGYPVIVSCWQLTPEELKEIADTGKIWLPITGASMTPVRLHIDTPFV